MERFTKFFTSLGGVLTSLAAVVGGVVALYVAFGGSDKASPNPPVVVDTTSDAAIEDWQTQVEDACRDFVRRVNQLGPKPTAGAGQVFYLQELIPIFSTLANEIRALEEPAAIREDVGRLLDSMDRQVELSQTEVNSAQVGDSATAEDARLENQAAGQDTDRLLAELGLQACVE
jgi:hypothetical protein